MGIDWENVKLKAESVKLDVEFAGLVAAGLVKDAVDTQKEKKKKKKQTIEDRNKELFNEAVKYAKDNRKKILDKYISSDDYDWDEVIGINLIREETGTVMTDRYIPNYLVEAVTDSGSFIIDIGFEGAFIVFYSLKMIFPVISCEYVSKQYNPNAKNQGDKWYKIFKEDKINVSKASEDYADYLVLKSTNINSMDDIRNATDMAKDYLRTAIDYWNERANSISSSEEHKLAMEIVKLFNEADKNLTIIESEELVSEKEEKDRENEDAIREAGEKGENEVSYALKWLDNYVIFDKFNNKGNAIKLENLQYIDETQEYDHILVGNNGIILIETKAYSGKIVIDASGNWTREKNGEIKGIKNPLQQVRRHEKLLKSIIPDGIEVLSIICIAKDSAIIEGGANSVVPIVKCDQLVEYIERNHTESILSDQMVEECCKCIKEHQVI